MRSRSLVPIATFLLVSAAAAATSPDIRSFSRGKVDANWRFMPPIVSDDGSKLAFQESTFTSNIDRTLIYDTTTGKQLLDLEKSPDFNSREVTGFSPDGTRYVQFTQRKDYHNDLQVINFADGKVTYEYVGEFGIQSFFTPDGKRLIHSLDRPKDGSEYNLLHFAVVDLQSAKMVAQLKTGEWERPNGVMSPDGKLLVTVDANTYRVKIWELATSRVVSSLEMFDHDGQISIRFLPDGQKLRGINRDGIIQTWDVKTGKRLTRVEPKNLSGSGTLTADGKLVLKGGLKSIVFEDAETAKDVALWRYDSPDYRIFRLDTFRNDTVVATTGEHQEGDLVLMRIPALSSLAPPRPRPPNTAVAIRAGLVPTTAPAVPVPPHSADDLLSASWWLDRAEAECLSITDTQKKGQIASALMVARAQLNDAAGEQRMLSLAEQCFPKNPNAKGPYANWSPLTYPKKQALLHDIRRLVAAGKTRDAAALVAANDTPREPPSLIAELATAQARGGDIPGAIATFQKCDPELRPRAETSAVWLLLVDQKPSLAEQLAGQISNPTFKSTAFEKIAAYKADHDDPDGAIQDFTKVSSERHSSAASKIVTALARHNDDADAQHFISTIPMEEQNDARARLVKAQLDRGDIDRATATAASVTGNAGFFLRNDFADAEVHFGREKAAIDAAAAQRVEFGLSDVVFNACLKYGKLDAASEMLSRLPHDLQPMSRQQENKNVMLLRLATALAQTNRIADAQAIVVKVQVAPRPDGKPDDNYLQATWEIAAANRRAGNLNEYDAARKPYVDALSIATGAPSRRDAQRMLFIFDITTGNYEVAENELAKSDDPDLISALAYAILPQIVPSPEQIRAPLDLQSQRWLVRLLAQGIDRPVIEFGMGPVAKASYDQKQFAEWLAFAESLPSPRARISAYLCMASQMIPTDPPEPND